MKIKLSRSQWETIGLKTGWIKKAQFQMKNQPQPAQQVQQGNPTPGFGSTNPNKQNVVYQNDPQNQAAIGGQVKIDEYVNRIIGGEDKAVVLQDLPNDIQTQVLQGVMGKQQG